MAIDPIKIGIRALAGGARRGNTALAGVGAALAAVGWLRRMAGPKRSLLYAKTLKPGEAVRIRLLGPEDAAEGTAEGTAEEPVEEVVVEG